MSDTVTLPPLPDPHGYIDFADGKVVWINHPVPYSQMEMLSRITSVVIAATSKKYVAPKPVFQTFADFDVMARDIVAQAGVVPTVSCDVVEGGGVNASRKAQKRARIVLLVS